MDKIRNSGRSSRQFCHRIVTAAVIAFGGSSCHPAGKGLGIGVFDTHVRAPWSSWIVSACSAVYLRKLQSEAQPECVRQLS